MTRPQPQCPRCGLVPVWPYGCPCGYVTAPGTTAAAPHPGPPTPHAGPQPWSQAGPPPHPYPGQHPSAYRPGPPVVVVVREKSAGVAILLSFLWLGAGHLYLGRTTPGALLMVLHVFLWLVLVVPVLGWLLGFFGWVASFIAVTISCATIAAEENERVRSRVW